MSPPATDEIRYPVRNSFSWILHAGGLRAFRQDGTGILAQRVMEYGWQAAAIEGGI